MSTPKRGHCRVLSNQRHQGPCRETPCPRLCVGPHGWCEIHRQNRKRGRKNWQEAGRGRIPRFEGGDWPRVVGRPIGALS